MNGGDYIALPAHGHSEKLEVRAERAAATTNIIKLILGSGSFALPWAFAMGGMAGAGFGVAVVSFLAMGTIWMLVRAKNAVGVENEDNYANIAGALLGSRWSMILRLATFLSCFGACAGYMTFTGELCAALIDVQPAKVILYLLPMFVMLSWITTFRHMAFWAFIGNLSFLCALAAVSTDAFITLSSRGFRPADDVVMFDRQNFPLFWGPAVFLFCIHYVALPIEKEMRYRKEFTTFVIPYSFSVCAALNVVFGALCYMAYGAGVHDNVMRNVRPGLVTTVTSLALAADLVVTFMLMLAPAREYVEEALLGQYPPPNRATVLKRNLLRTVLVLLIALVAMSVPNFALLIGVAGGVTDTFQTFVVPPMLYMAAEGSDFIKRRWGRLLQIGLFATIALGATFMLWTLANFSKELMAAF